MKMSIPSKVKSFRREMKKSRFKIWLRALLFVLFGSLFTFYLLRDIGNGYFTWGWTTILFMLFIPIGFWMSRLVPMRVGEEARAVTLSLDHIYLILIWVLVIVKLITSQITALITISDIIMCAILGIMFGRLGGIGTRVGELKIRYGLIKE